MRWLRHWLAGVLLAASSPVSVAAQALPPGEQTPRVDIAAHVREASLRFGLPEHWIYAVIRIESAGRTLAVSPAGAMGLMQLMPGTWARQRGRYALGSDPFDPRDNILAGASYLREMYDRYGPRGFLAAYNAGPGRYEAWRDTGRPLPLETRRYVAKLASLLQGEPPFFAAAMQPESGPQTASLPTSGISIEAVRGIEVDRLSNPFARSAQPGHDLFAPVSTTEQQ